MTTTPMPPVVPPDNDRGAQDSAGADREASYGAAVDETAEPGTEDESSADADYEASTGQRPETD